jgi:hypothetical protein
MQYNLQVILSPSHFKQPVLAEEKQSTPVDNTFVVPPVIQEQMPNDAKSK